MFAEGGTFVVVDLEPVGHVDLEALLVDLQQRHGPLRLTGLAFSATWFLVSHRHRVHLYAEGNW